MIKIADMIDKAKASGYDEINAEAKVCQDLILALISQSQYNRNVTVKGGVVMRSITNSTRRAMKFKVPAACVTTDALYTNSFNIYATDTLPTISMPEFSGLDYTTNAGASHKGNKIQANTTTAQAIRSASTENYIVNAFASNNFTTPLADDYVLQLGDVITVQDVANNKISYLNNVITDGTYVWKDDMELVTKPKWTASGFTDLVATNENANKNIGLNEETQTAASVEAGVNPYYQYDTEPGEIWDYFIAEYDVFQKGNTKHALVTHRGHSVSGPAFYLPEAEWCKITVVFDLVNRVANTYVDGVIENPDYVNTTSTVRRCITMIMSCTMKISMSRFIYS